MALGSTPKAQWKSAFPKKMYVATVVRLWVLIMAQSVSGAVERGKFW
jgi:hypothetical protein